MFCLAGGRQNGGWEAIYVNNTTVGIGDISLYVPSPRMDLNRLVSYRLETLPNMERHFERALRTTGQRSIRFPRSWEDSATMAAEAAARLLSGTHGRKLDMQALRYLVSGTETGLDYSKPLSAYVQGMLNAAGYNLPNHIASYQVQHACAGATAGILTTAALLSASRGDADFGVVTASDIARYEGKSTAEVTQGAGAAAVLIEANPALLEIDVARPGFYSSDVDDFFRPLGSVTARVKGQYSMVCYRDSLAGALADFAKRNMTTVRDLLLSTDYFVLHAPFRNMPGIALEKIFENELGLSPEAVRSHLEARGLYDSLEPIADTGNTYTASVFIALASLLRNRYAAEGNAIIGKSILVSSYGSGNTMILLSGRIAERAPSVIASWPNPLVDEGYSASADEYERWMHQGYQQPGTVNEAQGVPELLHTGTTDQQPTAGSFYLRDVRKDGYRDYGVVPQSGLQQAGTEQTTTANAER